MWAGELHLANQLPSIPRQVGPGPHGACGSRKSKSSHSLHSARRERHRVGYVCKQRWKGTALPSEGHSAWGLQSKVTRKASCFPTPQHGASSRVPQAQNLPQRPLWSLLSQTPGSLWKQQSDERCCFPLRLLVSKGFRGRLKGARGGVSRDIKEDPGASSQAVSKGDFSADCVPME